MGEKTYQKLIDELLRKDGNGDFYIYNKKNDQPYDWYETKEIKVKEITITIDEVMKKFKPEDLIDAIGIEKVETIIRAHKIKMLKNKIKK